MGSSLLTSSLAVMLEGPGAEGIESSTLALCLDLCWRTVSSLQVTIATPPPPPPPPCLLLLKQMVTGGANEGRSKRGREGEWRTPFLDLMFSFLFPPLWLESLGILCVYVRLRSWVSTFKTYNHITTQFFSHILNTNRFDYWLCIFSQLAHCFGSQANFPPQATVPHILSLVINRAYWCVLKGLKHMLCFCVGVCTASVLLHVSQHVPPGSCQFSCAILVMLVFSLCMCLSRWSGWCTG